MPGCFTTRSSSRGRRRRRTSAVRRSPTTARASASTPSSSRRRRLFSPGYGALERPRRVFVSANGDPAGPWKRIADEATLGVLGPPLDYPSGLRARRAGRLQPVRRVDPADPEHVYLGLEEVFETTNGGTTWTPSARTGTSLPCLEYGPRTAARRPPTPTSTPSPSAAGNVYFGNDGGVYARPAQGAGLDDPQRRPARPCSTTRPARRVGPAGVADLGRPAGQRRRRCCKPGADEVGLAVRRRRRRRPRRPGERQPAVNEYVYLDMALTTNGGRSDGRTPSYRDISPSCLASTSRRTRATRTPRFIAPLRRRRRRHRTTGSPAASSSGTTTQGLGHDLHRGDACDWKIVHDLGAGRARSRALAVGRRHDLRRLVRRAATSAAGRSSRDRHELRRRLAPGHRAGAAEPVRDRAHRRPANAAHVYAVYGGFSRRWLRGAGRATSSSRPTAAPRGPTSAATCPTRRATTSPDRNGRLTLATDIGVFTAMAGQGPAPSWAVLGTGCRRARRWWTSGCRRSGGRCSWPRMAAGCGSSR